MPTWTTKDGQKLDVREMTDQHLANARKAVDERRVNPYLHSCWVVDILDGPCYDCEMQGDWRREWLSHLDAEIQRRKGSLTEQVQAIRNSMT